MKEFSGRSTNERGAVILFCALVLIPLLFFAWSLTLDLDSAHRERDRVQQLTDDAALYSYRFLPQRDKAQAAARQYLARDAAVSSAAEITVDTDSVTITAAQISPFHFMHGLVALIGGKSLNAVTQKILSRARGTPLDAVILVDRSHYLAPTPRDGEQGWGSESEWPTAQLFRGYVELYDAQGRVLSGRLASQQCFNPSFSAVKRGAIRAYDYLAAFRLNAVAVAVFPGDGEGVSEIRPLMPQVKEHGQGESRWLASAQTREGMMNDYCLAAAGYETAHQGYALPGNDKAQFSKQSAVIPGAWLFDLQYVPFLRAEEVLWAQAARSTESADHRLAIAYITRTLTSVGFHAERGGMQESSLGLGLLISADLPRSAGRRFPAAEVTQGLRTEFARLKSILSSGKVRPGLKIKLYYLLNPSPLTDSPELWQALPQLAQFFRDESDANLELYVLAQRTAEEFTTRSIEAALLATKSAIISR